LRVASSTCNGAGAGSRGDPGAIIGGAIIGSRPYGYGYYDPYYDAPPPGYYQAPPGAYYEPNPRSGPRQCWVEAGPAGNTGYWTPC
jgi:hypothetical protein